MELRQGAAPPAFGELPLGKKDLKRLRQDGSRPLDSWEQYRALNDAIDEAYEVTDIGNREARFALLVMGILNAFVVIAASRPEVVSAVQGAQRTVATVLLGVYAVTAVYFLLQAIEALRPGRFRPQLGPLGKGQQRSSGWDSLLRGRHSPRRAQPLDRVVRRAGGATECGAGRAAP